MRRAFTLVEMMIVVLLIGILLGMAVPQWARARENSQSKSCISNLKRISDAKELFAHENNVPEGGSCTVNDVWPAYIRGTQPPSCASGGGYAVNNIGTDPTCSYAAGSFPHKL